MISMITFLILGSVNSQQHSQPFLLKKKLTLYKSLKAESYYQKQHTFLMCLELHIGHIEKFKNLN